MVAGQNTLTQSTQALYTQTQSSKIPKIEITGGRTKQPILNETKAPILETGQNRRFWKRDKTADFDNETKPPISKMRQNSRF